MVPPYFITSALRTPGDAMDSGPGTPTKNLSWDNVGLAFSFIVLDAIVSRTFSLGVGTSLVTAAVRCVTQLSLVALVLQKVFETNDPLAVARIACAYSPYGNSRDY